jgi:hypothetical protein
MIPESLLEGFGITMPSYYQGKMQNGQPSYSKVFYAYPGLVVPPKTKRTPLMPSETRVTILPVGPWKQVRAWYWKYPLEFTWECFLDPDDRSVLTRFTQVHNNRDRALVGGTIR